MTAVAILGDHQGAAPDGADWSAIQACAAVTVFSDHTDDPDRLAERLTSKPIRLM